MGKHERGVITQLEDSLVSLLNREKSTLHRGDPWYGHDKQLAIEILDDFPALVRAEHSGNQYKDAGDIRLHLEGTREPTLIEIKASAKAGLGTAFNISQDALTAYHIVEGAPSWSDWRVERGYEGDVRKILDRYAAARAESRIPEKGRVIRDAAKRGDQLAIKLRKQVVELANLDRREYIAELRRHPVNPDRLRQFVLALFMGAHTKAEIEELFERGIPSQPEEVPDSYFVYYTNVVGGEIIVHRHSRELIVSLLTVEDYELEFTDDRIGGRIEGRLEGTPVELFTFIHHWKNVFIGIQTPCINGFLGSYPRILLERARGEAAEGD